MPHNRPVKTRGGGSAVRSPIKVASRAAALVLPLLLVGFLGTLAGSVASGFVRVPRVSELATYRPDIITQITARDGSTIAYEQADDRHIPEFTIPHYESPVPSFERHRYPFAGAENALSGALGRLFALAEAYPDLKANRNMMQLSEELTTTENKVAFARQAFNDSVLGYNNRREVFPGSIVANMFAFQPAQLLEIESPEKREVPKVSFT